MSNILEKFFKKIRLFLYYFILQDNALYCIGKVGYIFQIKKDDCYKNNIF